MRYTEAPTRRAELLRRLSAEGYVSSGEVADELGVSDVTIRRDLHRLEREGLARRVAGGASVPTTGIPTDSDAVPFDERDQSGAAQKRAIADLAARVLAGPTLALDAGTTIAAFAAALPAGVTVITHSVPVVTLLVDRDDIDLICIGGSYQRQSRSFAGASAEASLDDLSADIAVLSATALDQRGIASANAMDAPMKRALAGIAGQVVVLAESRKIGVRAPIRVGPLSLVDTVITDDGVTESQLALLRDAGIDVLVAPLG